MTTPRVLGIDLSLTSTGLAYSNGQTTIGFKLTGEARLIAIRDKIMQWVTLERPQLVVLEGYSRASSNRREEMGEIGGVVRVALYERRIPVAVVAPRQRAKYALKGTADKYAVLAEAVRRLGYEGSSHDEADALWLRAMGLDAMGHPLCEMPKVNRAVLENITWPALGEAA